MVGRGRWWITRIYFFFFFNSFFVFDWVVDIQAFSLKRRQPLREELMVLNKQKTRRESACAAVRVKGKKNKKQREDITKYSTLRSRCFSRKRLFTSCCLGRFHHLSLHLFLPISLLLHRRSPFIFPISLSFFFTLRIG